MITVLMVEDDPLIVRMYSRLFKLSEGFEMHSAENGAKGLELLESLPAKPDVILLDTMMPEMNGMQMLDALKADSRYQSIPVVMLTNLADEASTSQALLHGAVNHIVKSQYDPQDIITMISDLMRILQPAQKEEENHEV